MTKDDGTDREHPSERGHRSTASSTPTAMTPADVGSSSPVSPHSREALEGIINALPGLVSVVDRSFNMLVANHAVVKTFGQGQLEEVLGKKCYRVRKGLEDICPQCGLKQAMETGERVTRLSTPEEEQRMGIVTKAYAIPLVNQDGKVWGGVEVIMDITDISEAEKTIRENERRFRLIIDQAADAVYLSDMTGRIVDVNQRAQEQIGYTREELLEKTVMDLDPHQPTLEACLRGWSDMSIGQSRVFESQHQRKDGLVYPVEVRSSAIELNGEKLILGFVQDISKRKQAEEQLKIIQFGIDHAQIAVFQTNDDGQIRYANERACQSLGYTAEELTSLTVPDIDPALDVGGWRKHRERTRDQDLLTVETRHRRKDGTEFPVEVTINRMLFDDRKLTFSFVRDISDRKRAQAEREQLDAHLQKVQKLESLGALAGGIAHDFNNLLSGVYGFIDLAMEASTEEEVRALLQRSSDTVDRARGLTHQLLTFSKGGSPIKKIQRLFPFVEETARFALSGSSISLRVETPDGPLPCNYDSTQIAQVIDNIVINAKEAMPRGGDLRISATARSFEPGAHPALGPGNYVLLAFEDTGVGMPEELLPRIFDPFFTTKQMGSGLGMATCYSIVKRHEGHIEVTSIPGKGTTVFIYLPASDKSAAEPLSLPVENVVSRGRILVMDDEEVVRDITSAMCRSLGHEVFCTADGDEAVRVFEEETAAGRPFDAVVLDLTVPGGAGGQEALGSIRRFAPDVPVFVSSGYAEDPVMANPTAYGFTGSIRKPFKKSDLARLLGQLD